MLCWLNALVLFIGMITVSTVCGKCGVLSAVMEVISVVNKLLGWCAWPVFLTKEKADHLSQPESLTCLICA